MYAHASDSSSKQPTLGVVIVEDKVQTSAEADKQSKRSLPHHDDLGYGGYGASSFGGYGPSASVAVEAPLPIGPAALPVAAPIAHPPIGPGAGLYTEAILPDALPVGSAYAPAYAPGYGG